MPMTGKKPSNRVAGRLPVVRFVTVQVTVRQVNAGYRLQRL
ncbi:hypothetical protein BFV94_4405 [Alteromonas macleodii]|uniref:Uncharacterized protein n=1 Tax=Alteromonas macleodii TaxID=28108 RepID=A0AB36FLY4_ALTMA|nr:hypothetical protein BFV95_4762 [Alteromonas macleodii]OES25552.1 hypothetical protein BFV94_4405 [Alteromonas macleodii]OES25853.1 hypothetical protein BFV93_4316 [Alteromonas macleodii]OES38625.1 hypothetical protein BFV96_4736 [Alteromonas macleodii]